MPGLGSRHPNSAPPTGVHRRVVSRTASNQRSPLGYGRSNRGAVDTLGRPPRQARSRAASAGRDAADQHFAGRPETAGGPCAFIVSRSGWRLNRKVRKKTESPQTPERFRSSEVHVGARPMMTSESFVEGRQTMRYLILASAAAATVATGIGLGFGPPAFAQAGSYQRSCRNYNSAGGALTAECADAQGRYHSSTLNTGQCRGD